MKEAFYFESDGKRLFAVLERPEMPVFRTGILFCHPYGEEKQRTCRIYGKLANSLCEKGFFVMRFDCRGYGDSEGEFEESTVETQIADTMRAAEVLRKESGLEGVELIGLRYGAMIAALVAERAPSVKGLTLWSPVTDGKLFVNSLIKNKLFAQMSSRGPRRTEAELMADLNDNGILDIDGYGLTSRQYEELNQVDLPSQILTFRGPVFSAMLKNELQLEKSLELLSQAYMKNGAEFDKRTFDEKIFWDARTHYAWYFPEQLHCETLAWLTRDRPE